MENTILVQIHAMLSILYMITVSAQFFRLRQCCNPQDPNEMHACFIFDIMILRNPKVQIASFAIGVGQVETAYAGLGISKAHPVRVVDIPSNVLSKHVMLMDELRCIAAAGDPRQEAEDRIHMIGNYLQTELLVKHSISLLSGGI